jgi:hypothetical protein
MPHSLGKITRWKLLTMEIFERGYYSKPIATTPGVPNIFSAGSVLRFVGTCECSSLEFRLNRYVYCRVLG